MTGKKVTFGSKPNNKLTTPATSEEWVKKREDAVEEPTKRLTIDIPDGLHRAIKVSCASRGTKMVDEIRVLLESHYMQKP